MGLSHAEAFGFHAIQLCAPHTLWWISFTVHFKTVVLWAKLRYLYHERHKDGAQCDKTREGGHRAESDAMARLCLICRSTTVQTQPRPSERACFLLWQQVEAVVITLITTAWGAPFLVVIPFFPDGYPGQ